MKKTVFVGIDVSKATFDATLYHPASSKQLHRQFELAIFDWREKDRQI